jgi:hypothetical protein
MSGVCALEYLRAKAAPRLNIQSTRGIVQQRFVKIGRVDQWKIGERMKHNSVLLVVDCGPESISLQNHGARRET